MLSKESLRKVLTARRQLIQDKESKNQLITAKFLDWFSQGDYKSLFTYVSINSEVDTKKIIRELFDKCDIFVPLTMGSMRQYKLPSVDNLFADKHGNLDFTRYDFVSQDADVVIVPLLGFNKKLHRIGYGGGFYDKFLENYKGIKVGLAYAEQAQEFDVGLLDVKMDIIITPNLIIKANDT